MLLFYKLGVGVSCFLSDRSCVPTVRPCFFMRTRSMNENCSFKLNINNERNTSLINSPPTGYETNWQLTLSIHKYHSDI